MSEDKKEDKSKPRKKKREFPHVDERAYILKWVEKKD